MGILMTLEVKVQPYRFHSIPFSAERESDLSVEEAFCKGFSIKSYPVVVPDAIPTYCLSAE